MVKPLTNALHRYEKLKKEQDRLMSEVFVHQIEVLVVLRMCQDKSSIRSVFLDIETTILN